MHPQITSHFVSVENVQRAVLIVSEKVGHIDKKRDRTQANRAQLVLQPSRRWTVCDAFDQAAREDSTTIKSIGVDGHRQVRLESRWNDFNVARLHLAKATRCQITGYATYTKGIRAVGRDRNFNHWINFGGIILRKPIGEGLTDLSRWQFDDAIVFVRQLHLVL